MVLNRLSEAGGRGAGGFLGGISNNPGVIIILVALGGLFIFRDKISEGFASIGQGIADFELPGISLPDITFPSFDFDFPEITFPDFNIDFGDPLGDISKGFEMFAGEQQSNFDNFVKQVTDFFNIGGSQDLDLPPDVPNTGLLSQEDILNCQCGTSIVQDSMGDVQQLCLPCDDEIIVVPPSGGIGVSDSIETFITPGEKQIEDSFQGIMEKVISSIPGMQAFIGGGPSFIGGAINPIPLCNKSIGEIAEEFGISASAASNKKFIECEESNFDFGTNTGSGLLPGETSIVTGGATLESEAIKAACTSCQLFNLNCEQCRRGMA